MEDEAEENANEAGEDVKPAKSKAKKTPTDPNESSDFNYLLSLSMWMLTEEKKNELLRNRDQRLAELKILKSKSPSQLWLEDLDELSNKLDEVENKERSKGAGMVSSSSSNKGKKNIKKEGLLGKMKTPTKKGKGKGETMPSERGIKIEYKVTEEMLKKFERADAAKVGGAGRVKKEKPVKSEAGAGGGDAPDDFDEFDALVEAGDKALVVKTEKAKPIPKPRAKKEPGEKKERAKPKSKDGLKQSKLDFGKKKGVSFMGDISKNTKLTFV